MKILFIDTVHPILEERLRKLGIKCVDGTSWARKKCIQKIAAFEGMVIRSRFPVDKDFLKHATNLQFIARSGAGLENIDLNFAKEHHIQCFNAPEGNRNAVGEHALSLLLSLFNNIPKGNTEVRQGIWDREGNRGVELTGKTIGIIGYGNNGSAFAQKLNGFDVKVLAYDKYKSNYGDQYAKASSMEEIFEKADVFSFHIPQTEETIGMGNQQFFNSFQQPIYLINTARGKIVKTKSLMQAIRSGQVLGACLDVLEYESSSFEGAEMKSSNPEWEELLQSDKVIFSPHVGGWTKESYFKLSNVLADKVISYLQLEE